MPQTKDSDEFQEVPKVVGGQGERVEKFWEVPLVEHAVKFGGHLEAELKQVDDVVALSGWAQADVLTRALVQEAASAGLNAERLADLLRAMLAYVPPLMGSRQRA